MLDWLASPASDLVLASVFAVEELGEPALATSYAVSPQAAFYRYHVIFLLRRFFCVSVEIGRLPSLVGRELFRADATAHSVHSFEDRVIFVHDVELCLARLDPFDQQLIARIVFQGYTQQEAARMLKCSRRWLISRLQAALDRLAELFLRHGVLDPAMRLSQKSCQEAKNVIFGGNDCD